MVHSSKDTSTVAEKAGSQRQEAAGHRVHSQERGHCFLSIQSRALTHGTVLLPFMVDHPASS